MSNNTIVAEEQQHLDEIASIIDDQLSDVDKKLNQSSATVLEQKKYLWENIYELDPEEIASNRMDISYEQNHWQQYEKRFRLLKKMRQNPYFGRIDFVFEGDDEPEILYIGLGGLRSETQFETYIYDWRAPISSIYYDFGIGEAYYEAPQGKMYGNVTEKRQIKIRNGLLQYAFISENNIDDDILQQELASAGSTKMKNIVATIQKEQNTIVRNSKDSIMVVQGVAGSGKTSIALHRIAYLLYQYRNTLSSSEVLIISPNNIFADYISNVLPELGEQNISEVSFDEIAYQELKGICKFETKYEQMEYILQCKSEDDARLTAIRHKKSIAFLNELNAYIEQLPDLLLNFTDLTIGEYTIESAQLRAWFFGFSNERGVFERIELIADRIVDDYETTFVVHLSMKARKDICARLYGMCISSNILQIYNRFITNSDSFIQPDFDIVNYEDVFPIVYLKLRLQGLTNSRFKRIKHVVIDEMQDYSMVQFALINYLFACKMTILGDINQVIDTFSKDQMLKDIHLIFNKDIALIQLLKSYRSTFEIAEFCRKLCGLNEAQSFERHGNAPQIVPCMNVNTMIQYIEHKIDCFEESGYTSCAIICKSATKAKSLFDMLKPEYQTKCNLMNSDSSHFTGGVMITNSYLVKGLEFDSVIIPDVTAEEYHTDRDRQILYISSTRALHDLSILHYGNPSRFIV